MPKTLTIEHKSNPFEIKVVDAAQGIIRGYLSTFNNVDYGKDRVRPGAFKKTISEALSRKTNKGKKYLWPFLWMHDPNKPIGGVIDAVEDAKGLLITAQLDISTNAAGTPNNALATSVFSGYEEGYIDEFSMGYKAIQKDYDSDGVRDLKECQIWEASAVTSLFAMNNEALVTDVKSAAQTHQQKDFADRYRSAQISNWLYDDFGALIDALRSSLLDMFRIGDQPEADLDTTVLNGSGGFIEALRSWVQTGISLDVASYLNPEDALCQASWRHPEMESKSGRTISKATADTLAGHAETLTNMAMQHKSMADLHYKALMSAASDLQTLLGTPENPDGEKRLEPLTALTSAEPDTKSTQTSTQDDDLAQFAAFLKSQLGK